MLASYAESSRRAGTTKRVVHSVPFVPSQGADAQAAFAKDGLPDELKKALAERALNAEMDHHLDPDSESGNTRNGYGRKTVLTDTSRIAWKSRVTVWRPSISS